MNYSAGVEEKKRILLTKAPFSAHAKEVKAGMDLVDFAFTNVKLDGSRLTRLGVSKILEGDVVDDVPLKEHMLVNAHKNVYRQMSECLEMKMEVDSKLLCSFHTLLTGASPPAYRKGAEPVYHMDFVPKIYDDMPSAIKEALLAVKRIDFGGDYILRGTAIHSAIVEVYPFDEKSEMVARCALQYELLRCGLFPVALDISETLYNTKTSDMISGLDGLALASIVSEAAILKLETLCELH